METESMVAKPMKYVLENINLANTRESATPISHSKIIIGYMVTFVILFAGNSSAYACAGGYLQEFLFHKYPEAKVANTAIKEAQLQGMLQGEEWSNNSGKSLHTWRSEKTKITIQALQNRIDSAVQASTILGDTSIFLLNEFTWIKIISDGKQIQVFRQPYGLKVSGLKVFTSRRVLDNLLDSEITWQQAIDLGLITSRCDNDCLSDKQFELLSQVISRQQQLVITSNN